MRSGDLLLVFSDGVTETFSPDDQEFGEEGLLALASEVRGQDVEAIEAAILRRLEAFAGGAKASDDRTLIVLKRD